jgi:hypothetical protein
VAESESWIARCIESVRTSNPGVPNEVVQVLQRELDGRLKNAALTKRETAALATELLDVSEVSSQDQTA